MLLCGCDQLGTSAPEKTAEELLSDEAQSAVRQSLRDPESAQFRGAGFAYPDQGMVCGSVNAKNGFGGYSGFQKYVYRRGKGVIIADDNVNEMLVDAHCNAGFSIQQASQFPAREANSEE
jgi:hypothetical protein